MIIKKINKISYMKIYFNKFLVKNQIICMKNRKKIKKNCINCYQKLNIIIQQNLFLKLSKNQEIKYNYFNKYRINSLKIRLKYIKLYSFLMIS